MITILWSLKARKDFLNNIHYIALLSPQNAIIVGDRIEKAVELLQQSPTGRQGRVIGTYEKLVPKTSLIIVYTRANKTDLIIVRIIHTARNWGSESWPS